MPNQIRLRGTLPVATASTQDKLVTVIKGSGGRQIRTSFSFYNAFTASLNQGDLFNTTLRPAIQDVLDEFESTVFAYGQTGAGKTYTI